ncbi:MAG: hypothetical protein JXR37_29225 [Kiritimatiellae bacterium]|nr:hypothetical protein [Kiritimatiellia bacterium]
MKASGTSAGTNGKRPIARRPTRVLAVDYLLVELPTGDDLYVTGHGLPFAENLMPENFWSDDDWFRAHSQKLFGHNSGYTGSSTIYRVKTKSVNGRDKDIVLKWNRMGQDVPGEETHEELTGAEFNSPYEEFSLVIEMREARRESPGRILTHKPLAIYVPSRRVELWQTGRREYKMQAKIRNHTEIVIDMFRPYAVIYEWIDGIDLAEACRRGAVDTETMQTLTLQVEREMRAKGFQVTDRKPQHIIVRPGREGGVLRDRTGRIAHAIVDFELLQRTPERETRVRKERRTEYLRRQAHRFEATAAPAASPRVGCVSIFGVHYVYGPAESTGGALWVVGKDPTLFDYFLPERWRHTPRTRLSATDHVHHTVTKDNIHLVWKLSRVGQQPDVDPFKPDEKSILEHGYNSPFEEVAVSFALSRRGVPTTYPRAIYMTGHQARTLQSLEDRSRYESHRHLLSPEGMPVLREDREYIVIWGYWNKPDELLAVQDSDYYQGIDALHALRQGLLSKTAYLDLMRKVRDRLASIGIEDLNLRGNHLLLSLDNSGQLLLDPDGFPQVRICNFELLRTARFDSEGAGML